MIWKACEGCSISPQGCEVCRAGIVKREAEAYIRLLEEAMDELEDTAKAQHAQLQRCGKLLAPSPELESCLRALGRIK